MTIRAIKLIPSFVQVRIYYDQRRNQEFSLGWALLISNFNRHNFKKKKTKKKEGKKPVYIIYINKK